MLTIWTDKIKHSTVGSSFRVTFSVAPNELEYLNKLYDCFNSMNWSSFPITADRKTEPNLSEIPTSSEKPNNCEVKNYCDDCLYTDTCDSKEFFYACTSKPTISKMEQVDEPKTQMKTQNSNLTFEKADERCKGCNHYKLTCDLFSEICRYQPKDEPTSSKMEQVDKDINVRSKDEPKPCEWCKFYDGENCFSQEPCKVMLYLKAEPQTERRE